MLTRLVIAITAFILIAATKPDDSTNKLTDQEKQDKWQLLFDGQSTKGWMTIHDEPLPDKYVQDGTLNPHPCDYMLITDSPFGDYVLSLDFKIMFYTVVVLLQGRGK